MRTVEYVVPLGENARKRHYHRNRAGKIIADEDIKENWKTYRKAFLGEAG